MSGDEWVLGRHLLDRRRSVGEGVDPSPWMARCLVRKLRWWLKMSPILAVFLASVTRARVRRHEAPVNCAVVSRSEPLLHEALDV